MHTIPRSVFPIAPQTVRLMDMNKTPLVLILFLLCTCAISCRMLRDADIVPGASWLYLPAFDDEKPDTWLDLSVYLDNEVIVQTNLPLKRVEASCLSITYPIKTCCADGSDSFGNLDVCINKSNREGICVSFYCLSGSFVGSKHRLDIVREEITIPYKVRSKGRSNRVSYSARWWK